MGLGYCPTCPLTLAAVLPVLVSFLITTPLTRALTLTSPVVGQVLLAVME